MSIDVECAASEEYRSSLPKQRGLILYDFLFCTGGAEKVTLSLTRGLPGADLCVGFRQPAIFSKSALDGVACYELARPPLFDVRGWRSVAGMHMFSKRAAWVADYDWAIFSGANAPMAIRHRTAGGNLYYCHTLPRLAYDLYDWYLDYLPLWQRPAFRTLAGYVRQRYEESLGRMDRIVANSVNVQQRLYRYLGVTAEVVYPPCDTEGFVWRAQGKYFLSTARLERYKRVDVIIDAFRRMPEQKLIIASGGADEGRLRLRAADAPNIVFVGWQSERALRELVGSAFATIYLAKDEDFGMSPIESMAAGKPVIGVAEGGIVETVTHGATGVLVSADPSVEELIGAVESLTLEDAVAMRSACEERAGLFGEERFLARMRDLIGDLSMSAAESR